MIWKTKRPKVWTKSLVIPSSKISNLNSCQNYRTISLISHPKQDHAPVYPQSTEKLLAEEQAGFTPGTIEQIFSSRVIIEKHRQHHRNLFHNLWTSRRRFQSVACRHVAGPRKFEHRGRTGSSQSGSA